MTSSTKISPLSYYLDSREVDVEDEYVLIDSGVLSEAVGGFVEMVLGWSRKDLAEALPVMAKNKGLICKRCRDNDLAQKFAKGGDKYQVGQIYRMTHLNFLRRFHIRNGAMKACLCL